MRVRVVTLLLAAPLVLGAAYVATYAIFDLASTCGGECRAEWKWPGVELWLVLQACLAGAVLVASLTFAGLIAARRTRAALIAMVVGVAILIAWLLVVAMRFAG